MWLFPLCLNVMGLRPLVGRWTRSIELVLFRSLASLRSGHCAPLVTFICLVLNGTLSGVPQLHLLGGIFQDQFYWWTMCEPVNTFTGNRLAQYTPYLKFGFQLWGTRCGYLTGRWAFKGGGRYRKKICCAKSALFHLVKHCHKHRGGGHGVCLFTL